MKRSLIIIIVLLLIGATIIAYLLRTRTGFDSIYLVPENAVLIVETKNPLEAWDRIIHSSAWNHYSRNSFFKELNSDINWFDSLMNSNRLLLKLMGEKPLIISQHPVGNNKYDFLYIIEAGKVAEYKNPGKMVASALGRDFEVSTRKYKNYIILDILDKVEHEYSFLAFVSGKIIFSWTPKLIEQSIDASEKMIIGRDINFLNVKSKVSGSGLFSIYFVHENLNKYVGTLSPEGRESFENATKAMKYTGLYFDISNDGKIDIEGYSGFDDISSLTYPDILNKGSLDIQTDKVIPNRIASLVKINFDDASSYIENSMRVLSDADYKDYLLNKMMIENHLKISLKENLYSWIKDEVVFLQTMPSNLGRTNEFAAVLNASDSAFAADNLHFIYKQIKKNSPVKIKSAIYKGYDIDYIAFPGFLKVLMGKTLKNIEKPYITQIGNSVIISNHPQTIKNIIDDYASGKTLKNTEKYSDFTSMFSNNTIAWIYVEPPVLYQNMKAFVNAETWKKIQNNKEYITCFDQGGLQINLSGNLLHFSLKTQYVEQVENWKMQFYNSDEMLSLFDYIETETSEKTEIKIEKDTIPEIFISDFDAKKYEEFYDDGSLKLSVEVKNGLKNGELKVFYPNGELKIRGKYKNDEPDGKWKYYTDEGHLKKIDEY